MDGSSRIEMAERLRSSDYNSVTGVSGLLEQAGNFGGRQDVFADGEAVFTDFILQVSDSQHGAILAKQSRSGRRGSRYSLYGDNVGFQAAEKNLLNWQR